MRYIKKLTPTSSFQNQYDIYKEKYTDITRDIFEDFKRDAFLTYNGENKAFILEEEQNGLCGYCEKKITVGCDDSHIEHIKPLKYFSHLGIEYTNFIVSCNGACNTNENCGHNKNNKVLLLSPIEDIDISDYFTFDKESGEIKPSEKDRDKAEVTIETLNLNTRRLNIQRLNAKKYLREHFNKNKQKDLTKKEMIFKEGFVSYLSYCYNINLRDI